MVTQEIKIGDKSNFLIVLLENTVNIGEVQVVAFGTQKRESVVGAISSMNARELEVLARSLTQTLAGRIAGLIAIQRSGEPGKVMPNTIFAASPLSRVTRTRLYW
jgi:hypothetical protein